MDTTDTLAPNSDRVTGDDFLTGAREFRITRTYVIPMEDRRDEDSKKYPIFIYLDGMGEKPWRPPVTLRRQIAAAWGTNSENYTGKRIRLWRDPTVKYGKDVKGGVRIEAMSDQRPDAHKQLISTGRGPKVKFNIPELPPLVTVAELAAQLTAATTMPELVAAWENVTSNKHGGNPDLVALKETRKQELAS